MDEVQLRQHLPQNALLRESPPSDQNDDSVESHELETEAMSPDTEEQREDIDVLELSPEREDDQESAAQRVRRELASNQTPNHSDTLSKLSSLVGNIRDTGPPPPLVRPTPLRPIDTNAVTSPKPTLPPPLHNFQRQLWELAKHHQAALASTPRAPVSPLFGGPPGAMSPAPRWMLPTWPSPPFPTHPALLRMPSFPNLNSPWPCSPSTMPHNLHPMLPPPFGPHLPFQHAIPLPKTAAATSSSRDPDLSPLDLSGSSKAKSSPADSSSSDLASPLKDISPCQPSPKRTRTDDAKNNVAEKHEERTLQPHATMVSNFNMKNTPDKHFLPQSPFLGNISQAHQIASPFRTPVSMPFYQRSPPISRPTNGGDADMHVNRRRRFLSPESVRILTDWYKEHEEHPYPSDQMVESLAGQAGISVFQVKKWMANKRVRSCNTLAFNGSIHPKKLQKLMQLQEDSEASPPCDEDPAEDTRRTTPRTSRGSRFLDPCAVDHMNKWYTDHLVYPYPTEEEKNIIAKDAALTVAQVTCWFANKRNRNNNTKKLSSKNMWQPVNRKVEFSESPERPLLGHYPAHPGFHPTHLMPPLELLHQRASDSN